MVTLKKASSAGRAAYAATRKAGGSSADARKAYNRAYHAIWQKTDRERANGYQRRHRGMDPAAAAALLSAAKVCAICGRARRLVPDHEHATGRLRGALCVPCNVAIGILGDTADGVQRAVNYLRSVTSKNAAPPKNPGVVMRRKVKRPLGRGAHSAAAGPGPCSRLE